MRTAARRSRHASGYRRQRLPVDIHPDDAPSEEVEDEEDPEKIEVHVHVHRGAESSARPKRRAARSPLTGVLFDWQGHYDRVCVRPPPLARGRWSLVATCRNCNANVPFAAKSCSRCGAPRKLRGLSKIIAAVGLGIVALLFAFCAHVLGDSVAEHRPRAPSGQWANYEEGPTIIEVQATPYPLNEARFSTTRSGLSDSGLAIR